MAVSPDGQYIFSAGPLFKGSFKGNRGSLGFPEQVHTWGQALWSTNIKEKGRFADALTVPEGHRFPVTAAVFSADGKSLITATGKGRHPGEVMMWELPSGKQKLPRIDYKASTFYSESGDEDLLGLPASLREAPGVEFLALSPDGSCLATAYVSARIKELGHATIRLWDVSKGKEKGYVMIPNQSVHSLAFVPDNTMLAVGGGKTGEGSIWLWMCPKENPWGHCAGIRNRSRLWQYLRTESTWPQAVVAVWSKSGIFSRNGRFDLNSCQNRPSRSYHWPTHPMEKR
jgi:WD40 repeat protein